MTVALYNLDTPPNEVWTQLKEANQNFAMKQIQKNTWNFAVDIARFSMTNLESTSANDLMLEQAIHEFTTTVTGIRDQILESFGKNSIQVGQSILDDLNRQLSIVHQRLEGLTRESAALNPALKESIASVNASTSAFSSLLSTLRLPNTKGELAEASVIDSIKTAFLAIPSVRIEALGGSGDTDAIIHFELSGLEMAKVVVECKNRNSWSNGFLTQLEADLSKHRAHFGLLVTSILPKEGKTRGYAISERNGIIIIATPDLAPSIALVLYELVRSLDRLSAKGQTIQTLFSSRELVECVTNNLSLVQPLRNVVAVMDKAHADITTTVSKIIDAIQRNNAKLAESFPSDGVKLS